MGIVILICDSASSFLQARYVAHRPRSTDARAASDLEPDMEDLCNLCSPLPYATPAEARNHSVEVYPMAKEKTKKREEDTAVCVLEWVPKGAADATDEERQVLLVKRPEKGACVKLIACCKTRR